MYGQPEFAHQSPYFRFRCRLYRCQRAKCRKSFQLSRNPSLLDAMFVTPQLLHCPNLQVLNIEPKLVEFLVVAATPIAQDSAQVCVYQTSSDRRKR